MSTRGIVVRGWRIGAVVPDGLSCYFDPLTERVEIHPLTDEEKGVRFDMLGSVSAMGEGEEHYEGGALLQGSLFDEGDPQCG